MEPQILEETGVFSRTTFDEGGRIAYDLEKSLYLPVPAEKLFDLRRENVQSFMEGTNNFLGNEKPFQIFNREKVCSTRQGMFNTYVGEDKRYGWTSFRSHAVLDNIQLSKDGTAVIMNLKDTERGNEEICIALDSMPKFAFLRSRFPENLNIENRAGLYLSIGSDHLPHFHRSENLKNQIILRRTEAYLE